MTNTSQFYLRRLHGITGIFPLGYFLLFHLRQGGTFSAKGILISSLMLWLPLAYHCLYGLFITYQGGSNIIAYPYVRNFMYYCQRVSGLLILIFVILHVYLMKTENYSFTTPYNFLLFAGVILSVFHLSNGFFGFLVDMGITVGDRAQKAAVILSFVAFIAFGIYGIQKYFAFIP